MWALQCSALQPAMLQGYSGFIPKRKGVLRIGGAIASVTAVGFVALTAQDVVQFGEIPHPGGFIPRTNSQGKKNWAKLFDPTNPAPSGAAVPDDSFRTELMKTGYLTQAAYAYFKYCTEPEQKDSIPEKGLPIGNIPKKLISPVNAGSKAAAEYNVPDEDSFIIQATAGIYPGEIGGLLQSDGSLSTNPIGFVAVSEDARGKRDIAIVFRGTQTGNELLTDVTAFMTAWDQETQKGVTAGARKRMRSGVYVEQGFEDMYRRFTSTPGNTLSLQGQVQSAVEALLVKYGDSVESITTCGHSLGGALASLCAFDLASSEVNKVGGKAGGKLIPVTAFTWEAPRVGNAVYAAKFGNQKPDVDANVAERARHPYVNMFRVVDVKDAVPKEPYLAPRRLLRFWKILPFLYASICKASTGRADSSGNAYGFHHGGTQLLVDIQNAWETKSSGVVKPSGGVLGTLLRKVGLGRIEPKATLQAHSLWINMWLVDHSVVIPESERK